MIKHFSKWLELVPLPYHSNEGASYAFLDKVFNSIGALTKIIINQGIIFFGEFQKFCE
jgi:hypothetical protein